MKNIICLLFLSFAFFVSCEEEALLPSYKDKPYAKENPDMSKPLVASYKNLYGVNIIYEFDLTSDFLFNFEDKNSVEYWRKLEISQFDKNSVDYGLNQFEELILSNFKEEVEFNGQIFQSDFKSKKFPKTIFVVDSISGNYKGLGQYIEELNNYESTKYFSFLWNGFEPMFSFNEKVLEVSDNITKIKCRNSMLYCFLSELFIKRKLLDELPMSFYDSMQDLYGTSATELAIQEKADSIKTGPKYYYNPKWYTSKGFALTSSSPAGIYGVVTPYNRLLDVTKNYNFPTKERDLRNLLHVILFESDVKNIRDYYKNEAILPRIKTLIYALYSYGIDVKAINPSIEEYFTD